MAALLLIALTVPESSDRAIGDSLLSALPGQVSVNAGRQLTAPLNLLLALAYMLLQCWPVLLASIHAAD